MEKTRSSGLSKGARIGFILALWVITAWLLYPLIVLDSVNMENAKQYLYRSSAGIAIMVILFGKTICDLLFPQDLSKKKSLFYTIFLTVYSVVLIAGIMFVILRMLIVYVKKSDTGGAIF